MSGKRRRFTKEFKAEVVKLVLHGGRGVPEVCREHGLGETSVYNWVKLIGVCTGGARQGAGWHPRGGRAGRVNVGLDEAVVEHGYGEFAGAIRRPQCTRASMGAPRPGQGAGSVRKSGRSSAEALD
jgi:hypothetical protein